MKKKNGQYSNGSVVASSVRVPGDVCQRSEPLLCHLATSYPLSVYGRVVISSYFMLRLQGHEGNCLIVSSRCVSPLFEMLITCHLFSTPVKMVEAVACAIRNGGKVSFNSVLNIVVQCAATGKIHIAPVLHFRGV